MTNFVFESIIKIFAIIAKSDGIAEEEILVFDRFLKAHFDDARYKSFKNYFLNYIETIEGNLAEMLEIASHVANELSTEQRFLIYVRLNELVRADGNITDRELEFIHTLARIFHFSDGFTDITNQFVFSHKKELLKSEAVGILDSGLIRFREKDFNIGFKSNSEIAFSFLPDLGFFIIKVLSSRDQLYLNNEIVKVGVNYFLKPGSLVMSENGGQQLHFSNLWSAIHQVEDSNSSVLLCRNLVYHHPNGKTGLHEFSFRAQAGDLIAIMGPSGSGKSTLLNIINGNFKPTSGTVTFNGTDIHSQPDGVKQFFGYVPQEDLLIDDLTVYENLFFPALLSLPQLSRDEIRTSVDNLLKELGLFQVRNLRVGNSLSKTISGGQRKRLNISLELIRQPSVLFIDEPTSGLSSRDSDNIMSLLRDLSFKGTLIFTVIHQPSSDIYKLFDQLILLDVGGYSIFTGNPIAAVSYFKKAINHVTSHISACPACGNINPEVIFNIVESKVIDEFGHPIADRKTNPADWYSRFRQKSGNAPETIELQPRKILDGPRPSIWTQMGVFISRDWLSKMANKQYLAITLGEPLVLAFILAFIVRYFPVSATFENRYYFSENENLPSFIFIAIIVSLFMGLTLSAEEIFKDQKILKREEFLQLSRLGYLFSKIGIQFFISFIQTVLFAGLSCYILGNPDMFTTYFIILFSCACFANMLALNISSSFPAIITIYILIPILLIPQLILGGIIVNFDKMNPSIARYGKVPFIGDLMASRWAFEAACIAQFKDNQFDRHFFKINKEISKANFKLFYWLPEMDNITNQLNEALMEAQPERINNAIEITRNYYPLLAFEIEKENRFNKYIHFDTNLLRPENISLTSVLELEKYMARLERFYRKRINFFQAKKDKKEAEIQAKIGKSGFLELYRDHHNEALQNFVRRSGQENRIVHARGHLVQLIDPIYNDEVIPQNILDYQAHFFSPVKFFLGKSFSTFCFNIFVLWLMVFALFLSLYFDGLKKLLQFKFRKKTT